MIMEKCAIYENDGGISIVYPSPSLFDSQSLDRELLRQQNIDFQSDDEVYDWIFKKDVPEGKDYKVIDVSEIPQDRTFRSAWEISE